MKSDTRNRRFRFFIACALMIPVTTGVATGAESIKTPSDYIKGFNIGKQLSKSNPRTSGDIRCIDAYFGRVAKNDLIQPGMVASSTTKTLNSYYGYLGCMEGANFPNRKPPAKISFQKPLNAPGIWGGASESAKPWTFRLKNGSELKESDFEELRASIEIGCSDSDGEGESKNCSDTLIQRQFPGAFNEEKTLACVQQRVDSNWSISGVTFILPTLSLDPEWDPNEYPTSDSEFFSDREQVQLFDQVPLRVLTAIRYQDDINEEFQFYGWLHLLTWDDKTLVHFLSPCATFIESQSSYFFDLPKAPVAFKAPAGKVNKSSNAYKILFNVGSNFAKVSTSSDNATSQCSSAAKSGMIKNKGIPQYLGVQAKQLQSLLKTASGYKGCLDGFSDWVNGDLD